MEKNYYLGLDIGTNSLGFSVADENFNIMKAKGKKLWGVRLFDEASTAEIRRLKRGNRRRLDRKKLKIAWLQEIFAEEISKVDSNFLNRIKYSNLYLEDKLIKNFKLNSKDSLFYDARDEGHYTDKDFHREYPTIYHLRKELLYKPAKDVRFLYLALHNLCKRRGNFLYEGDIATNNSLISAFNSFINFAKNIEEDLGLTSSFLLKQIKPDVEKTLIEYINEKHGIRETKQKFHELLQVESKLDKKIVDILIDGKVNLSDLFILELDDKIKFSFQDESIEETLSTLEQYLTDEQISFIRNLKNLYSIMQIKKMLTNNNFICEAMVDIYETHRKQLEFFKKLIKDYYPKHKFDIFKNPQFEKAIFVNYPIYSGIDSYNGSKHVLGSTSDRTKEMFYKYVESILSQTPDINNYDESIFNKRRKIVLSWIDEDNFLLKPRSKKNSVFPNALILNEAEQILKANKEAFPFLTKQDNSGLSNIEKILEIIKFRVPYFVGPLGKCENGENNFSWSERRNDLPLKPWTINKIFDFDKSEDKFVQRMTNKCTYLHDQDVLPKHSLIYSKFRVLNELNNLKINGEAINVAMKQNIFNNLFKKVKNVTINKLKQLLLSEGYFTKDELSNLTITGVDKDFKNQLSSYTDLILKGFAPELIEKNEEVFENIIKWHTIISDKNRLIYRIRRKYPGLFTEKELMALKSLNYSKWGTLSYKFLCELKFGNKTTGEATCVLDELWNTNLNLQQILFSPNYTLNEIISNYNKSIINQLTYQDVEELYCSPSVKRAVWQAIKLINEIKDLMGKLPDRIFVEVTRDDKEKGEKGRKLSRKDNILKLYSSKEFINSVKGLTIDLNRLQNELNKVDNLNLRSDKLYHYFLQLGKCMYSGKPIELDNLYNERCYDIEHIIPQAKIKDDSLNNTVLVCTELNEIKQDVYPLPLKWIEKMQDYWRMLQKHGLISKNKLERLLRRTPLTDEELSGFIERQIVETNQSTKAVIELLKKLFDNPNRIVYSKARLITDFRKKYGIYKSREVNDLHHAKDSYLNIVVGNVIYSRFTLSPRNYCKDNNANNSLTLKIDNLFDKTIMSPNGSKVVWNGKTDISRIKKICNKNDCLVSRMSYSLRNGAFYDETIYKSINNNPKSMAKIPLKGNFDNPLSDIKKYGGFGKFNYAYFMLVESEDKKGNKIKTIESVPILIYRKFKDSINKEEEILKYIIKENGLKNARILIPKINYKSILKIGTGEYLLAGKTGDQYVLHNFNQWFVDNKTARYVKIISKYFEIDKNHLANKLEKTDDKIIVSPKTKIHNEEQTLTKEENLLLYKQLIDQLNKPIYNNTPLKTNIRTILINKKEIFEGLSIENQVRVLFNVIKRISTGSNLVDLSLLGDKKSVGMITINKNITGKKIFLILRSITGTKEKKIKL